MQRSHPRQNQADLTRLPTLFFVERFSTTVHLTVALRGSLFLVQRNAEFLAEHGFDALEIFVHENKLPLDIGMPRFRALPSE